MLDQLSGEITSSNSAHQIAEARCLLEAMELHLIFSTGLMCDILGRTNALRCRMPSTTLDLSRSVVLIEATTLDDLSRGILGLFLK